MAGKGFIVEDTNADQGLTLLCTSSDYLQAEIIRQVLQGEGIPCFADGENSIALFTPAAVDIRILVRKCDGPRAIEALKDIAQQTSQRIDIS
jgi:hypothetical protein